MEQERLLHCGIVRPSMLLRTVNDLVSIRTGSTSSHRSVVVEHCSRVAVKDIQSHLLYRVSYIPDKRVRGSVVAGVRAHLTQSGDTVPKG
jgi:hypothetical protein